MRARIVIPEVIYLHNVLIKTQMNNMLVAWIPGQGVSVNHPAIVEILIQQLESPRTLPPDSLGWIYILTPLLRADDEIQQSTALRWISEFLDFVPEVMVPFTPRLIPAILPNLAHHVPAMKSAAIETNASLFALIQSLPNPAQSGPAAGPTSMSTASSLKAIPGSPPHRQPTKESQQTLSSGASLSSREDIPGLLDGADKNTPTPTMRNRMLSVGTETAAGAPQTLAIAETNGAPQSRSGSPTTSQMNMATASSMPQTGSPVSTQPPPFDDIDPFDYPATVNALTFQFLSEHEETRVTALKWLLMLHQKAPRKVSRPQGLGWCLRKPH